LFFAAALIHVGSNYVIDVCQGLAEEKLYNNLDVSVATALKSRREVSSLTAFRLICLSVSHFIRHSVTHLCFLRHKRTTGTLQVGYLASRTVEYPC